MRRRQVFGRPLAWVLFCECVAILTAIVGVYVWDAVNTHSLFVVTYQWLMHGDCPPAILAAVIGLTGYFHETHLRQLDERRKQDDMRKSAEDYEK